MTSLAIRMTLAAITTLVLVGLWSGVRPSAPAAAASQTLAIKLAFVCRNGDFQPLPSGPGGAAGEGEFVLVIENVGTEPVEGKLFAGKTQAQKGGMHKVAAVDIAPTEATKVAVRVGFYLTQVIKFVVSVEVDGDPSMDAWATTEFYATPEAVPAC